MRAQRLRFGLALALIAATSLCASPLLAFMPKAERILRAAAKENRQASRTQALKLALSLRVGDREPIATGSLLTHPNGLARLELVDGAGLVERHLLLGTEHTASRAGEELEASRSFLPPLFLLQASSQLLLEQALSDYGLDTEAVGLATCGSRVCYVIGDRTRVPPPPPPTEEELEQMRADEQAGDTAVPDEFPTDDSGSSPGSNPGSDFGSDPGTGWGALAELSDSPAVPTIWLDQQTFEIVRIESLAGVAIELGPTVAWDELRFPEFITIFEPDKEPVRLEVGGVIPVNAPAAEFGRSWLLAPASELPTSPRRAPTSPTPTPSPSTPAPTPAPPGAP